MPFNIFKPIFKPILFKSIGAVFVWLVGISVHAQPPLTITDEDQMPSLQGHLSIFVDSSSQQRFNQIRMAYAKKLFQSTKHDVFHFRVYSTTQWLHFTLTNLESHLLTRFLVVSSPHINRITLYAGEKEETRLVGLIGDTFPFDKRLVQSPRLVFPISVPANTTASYWIHLEQWNGTMIFGLTLRNAAAFERQTERDYLIWAAVGGLLLTLILFNGFLWINLRQWLYLIYAFYVASIIFYMAAETGLGFQFLWPGWVRLQNNSRGLSGLCTLFWWLWLMQLFIQQTRANSRWYNLIRIQRGIIGACILLMIYVVAFVQYRNGDWLTTIYALLIDTGVLVSFILIGIAGSLIEQIRRKNSLALYYTFTTLPMLAGTFLGALMRSGAIESIADPYILVVIGILLETILVAFGFAYRYNLEQREKQKTQTALNQANINILNAQETERRRLAQDLHDDIGTSLLALRGKLPPTNPDAHHLLDQIITDVRAVSHNLMPDELTTLGLSGALNEAARRLEESSGISSRIRFLFVSAGEVVPLSQVAELALYRAVLELMHNVVRHSRATEAVVQLVYHPDGLNVTVEDNGQGFAYKEGRDSSGIGLKSVASRTEWLGGKLAIDSSAAGTTIRLDIPYDNHTS